MIVCVPSSLSLLQRVRTGVNIFVILHLTGPVSGHLPVLPQVILVAHQDDAGVSVTILQCPMTDDVNPATIDNTFLNWCLLVMYLWAMLAVW